MKDLFYDYIDLYEQRDTLKSLQLVLRSPHIKYDQLCSSIQAFQQIINFTDACTFKTFQEAYVAASALLNVLENDPALIHITQAFRDQINWEKHFLEIYILNEPTDKDSNTSSDSNFNEILYNLKNSHFISDEDIEDLMAPFPEEYHSFVTHILKTLQKWKQLLQLKPSLKTLFESQFPIYTQQPWHFFVYPNKPNPLPDQKDDCTPLIFMELFENQNYEELLKVYLDKKTILVFESITIFLQFINIPSVYSILIKKNVFVYILNLYPKEQISVQYLHKAEIKHLQTIFLSKNLHLTKNGQLFSELLLKSLHQTNEDLNRDSSQDNILYDLSKKILFEIQSESYGSKRHIALRIQNHYDKWFGEHKINFSENSVNDYSNDYFLAKLNSESSQRFRRKPSCREKIRLAHIVPQIMDGGHAPSIILNNFLTFADRNKFDLFVFSTERLVTHNLEYPVATYSSLSSLETGMHLIEKHRSKNVKIDVEQNPILYEKTSESIINKLKQNNIDIAIFHGPDELNTLISTFSDVPLKVFFEHGTAPTYPQFDINIFSAEETLKLFEEKFSSQKGKNYFLNFCVDPRKTWDPLPYFKEAIGVPSDSFIMTTISNHLEARLSTEMCEAICEILRLSPKAYYAPMGQIKNPQAFLKRFGIYQNRVFILGQKVNPSQYARSMELYLNEFPFGSCLGILDAMASGCPVVSMFDEHGPPQSRYGATFFGKDHVITSGNVHEYIKLASRLANDPFFYKEWSDYALSEFNKRIDVQSYVKSFEDILISNLVS